MNKKLFFIYFFIYTVVGLYMTSSFALFSHEKMTQITAIICSYNNEKFCEKNLNSVLFQNYDSSKINYNIIYINDCSSDKTQDFAEYYIKNSLNQSVKTIHNTIRKGALRNIYEAVHSLEDDTIVMLVDGDDWLAHNNVVSKIVDEYSDQALWLTYGQFINYPSKTLGCCRLFPYDILKNNNFRKYDFISAHLKTFKAGLFKKINKSDLVYNNNFFDVVSDVAFMIPMLEMAGSAHIKFIPEVLYVYNHGSLLNDYKINAEKSHKTERYIRNLKKYHSINIIENH